MKRFFVVLLIMGQCQFASSEPQIYGSMQYSYEREPQKSSQYRQDKGETFLDQYSQSKKKRRGTLNHQDSYIGIKGEMDIGNGNAIIYQWEIGPEK